MFPIPAKGGTFLKFKRWIIPQGEPDAALALMDAGYPLKAVAEMMGMSDINAKVIHKKALTSLQAFCAAG